MKKALGQIDPVFLKVEWWCGTGEGGGQQMLSSATMELLCWQGPNFSTGTLYLQKDTIFLRQWTYHWMPLQVGWMNVRYSTGTDRSVISKRMAWKTCSVM